MPRMIKTVGIRGLRVIRSEQKAQYVEVLAVLTVKRRPPCTRCGDHRPWVHGNHHRTVRHLDVFGRPCRLKIEHSRYRCRLCGKTFNPPLPGIASGKHSSEPFREDVAKQHHDGIPTSVMAERKGIGNATVERIYHHFNQRKAAERTSIQCPKYLGIDEHSLRKKRSFATTFCDLKNHKVFDVVEGKSAQALEAFLCRLEGREKVRVVCIDLSATYRRIIRRYFPNAKIVADRFHVIRLVTERFMTLAREIAPRIRNNRGLLVLLRMNPKNLDESQQQRLKHILESNPALATVYEEMQALRRLLNLKHQKARACRVHAVTLLDTIQRLRMSGAECLRKLGRTLKLWIEPIARMWRFTKNNGITEGFHRKMKLIQRRAYGFRNFENYRIRVIAHCG
jgi:transposase